MEILTRYEIPNPQYKWGLQEKYAELVYNGKRKELLIKTVILCMDSYYELLRETAEENCQWPFIPDVDEPAINIRGVEFIGSPCQKKRHATIYAVPLGCSIRQDAVDVMDKIKMITINEKEHG